MVLAWDQRKRGKVALPAFESIALNSRRVVIAFDSDAFTKEGVHGAMARLGDFLAHRGAEVQYLYLPHGANGAKTGVDDYLVAHRSEEIWDLCRDELTPLPGEAVAEKEDDFADIEEEDGSDLLDEIVEYITVYCSFSSHEQADAIAVWVLHSYLFDAFSTTPRLAITAAAIQCGKTRVLETIEALALGSCLSISVSGPYLFRSIGLRPVTLLLDEFENIWQDDSDRGQDLRAIIDAGHRKGATVGRVVSQGSELVPRDFAVFTPVALAGVGRLPDSVHSRSVVIRMRRRKPSETVEPYERDEAWALADPLRRRLGAWAKRNRERLVGLRPVLPEGIVDRPADVWRPLAAVAQVVGGHWPKTLAAACVRLTREQEAGREDLSTLLLDHIRSVFDGIDALDETGRPTEPPVDKMFSAELVERLCAREDWPWGSLPRIGPLTPYGLSRRLDAFDIGPRQIRVGDKSNKGYERGMFVDVWTRFTTVPDPDPRTSDPAPPGKGKQAKQKKQPSSDPISDVSPFENVSEVGNTTQKGKHENPPSTRDVSDVSDVSPLDGDRVRGTRGVVDLDEIEGSS